jgi:hypothetical protein
MLESEFWALVDQSREAAGGRVGAQARELERLLTGRSAEDLIAFDRIFQTLRVRANRYDLWDAGFLVDNGMGDDGFRDFRAWLISRGRTVYEFVLADPENLADVPGARAGEVNGELFSYAVDAAYEATHKADLPSEGPFDEEPEGESVDDEDIPLRLPRLYAAVRDQWEEPSGSASRKHDETSSTDDESLFEAELAKLARLRDSLPGAGGPEISRRSSTAIPCPFCGVELPDSGSLREHMRSAHPPRPS